MGLRRRVAYGWQLARSPAASRGTAAQTPERTWTLDAVGRPTASKWDDIGRAQRGRLELNANHIIFVLFAPQSQQPPPLTQGMREDLILLAMGTFETERPLALQWPAWWEGHHKSILLSPAVAPLSTSKLPLAMHGNVGWQPDGGVYQQQADFVSKDMGPTPLVDWALEAAAKLRALATMEPWPIPDGVVPTALLDFLKAIGVRGDAVAAVAAALVSIQCEAARSLEIAKARANAALYALLGVPQSGTVTAGNTSTTACQQCSEPVTAVFLVRPGTKYADRIIDKASVEATARLQEAIGAKGVHVTAELRAVGALHRTHGAAVCLVCAAFEITHCRLVAAGVIQLPTAVTESQVREQMRLERQGVAKWASRLLRYHA